MKNIRLLQTCMIAGLPRSPAEGIQTVNDADAERLIDAGMAEDAEVDVDDVSDDLDGLKKPALLAIAGTEEVHLEDGATVAQIREAIRAKRADAEN